MSSLCQMEGRGTDTSAFQKTPRISAHHHGLGLQTLMKYVSSKLLIQSCKLPSLPADTYLTLYPSCVLVKSIGSVGSCNSTVS